MNLEFLQFRQLLALTRRRADAVRGSFLRLRADQRGVSLASMALMLPIMIGFIGLAVDVGLWQVNKRAMQGAADRAAYSAAIAAVNSATKAQATTEAMTTMAMAGFADGTNGVTITVNNPAKTGTFASDSTSWEVIAEAPQNLYFSQLFLSEAPTAAVRAVATKGSTSTSGCILTLNSSVSGATSFSNNAKIIDENCAVFTNSSSTSALKCVNNCDLASDTYTVGGYSVSNNGSLSGKTNSTGVAAATDPYASRTVPNSSSLTCTRTTKLTVNSNQTINPGVYCAGIDVAANKTLTMTAGTYYIKKLFNFGGNSTLEATSGVTIVMLDDACVGDGTCKKEKGIGNNVTLNITAPTSGTYKGIAFYAQGTKNTRQEFSNNVYLNVQGALYAPGDTFYFNNNADFDNALCAQVISDQVVFENNASMGTECDDAGVTKIGNAGGSSKKSKLVE